MAKHSNPADFRTAAAERMAQWAQVGAITNAGLTSDLAYVGLEVTIKPSDTPSVTLETKTDPNEGLPAGTKRSDFTSEALAKYDAETLATAQRRMWALVRNRQQNSIVSADEATETLRGLGYSDASLPKLESDVAVYTHDAAGKAKLYGFRVAGKPDKEEIRSRFEQIAPPHPDNVAIQSAYPEATNLTPAVTDVIVSTSVNWPTKCEF